MEVRRTNWEKVGVGNGLVSKRKSWQSINKDETISHGDQLKKVTCFSTCIRDKSLHTTGRHMHSRQAICTWAICLIALSISREFLSAYAQSNHVSGQTSLLWFCFFLLQFVHSFGTDRGNPIPVLHCKNSLLEEALLHRRLKGTCGRVQLGESTKIWDWGAHTSNNIILKQS